MYDILIVGGGASGFFAAIQAAEHNPNLKIGILEKGKEVLSKVRISGGGRCNVTHAEFDPRALTKYYPRGEKELRGPFHQFCSGDTIAFFEERGISLKIEEDGRMFPTSNSSETIIECFRSEADRLKIEVLKHSGVTQFNQIEQNGALVWDVTTIKHAYNCTKLLIASGSSPKMWSLLEKLGHSIVPPVPSLFTFNCKDARIEGIPGVSTNATVAVLPKTQTGTKITIPLKSQVANKAVLNSEGPVLITHWGLSGPAILKLSAWGALLLNEYNYQFKIRVNWLPEYYQESVINVLMEVKGLEAKKTVLRTKAVDIPKRLWTKLVSAADIKTDEKWADVTKNKLQELAKQLTECELLIDGKSTFKDEFVTAGGVELSEINFKTMESKIIPNLYFSGEVINVDAITGGFNFQNAWSTGYLAGVAMAE